MIVTVALPAGLPAHVAALTAIVPVGVSAGDTVAVAPLARLVTVAVPVPVIDPAVSVTVTVYG